MTLLMIPSEPTTVASRKTFGDALVRFGGPNDKVVVLDADLSKSTMSKHFAEAHPERFVEMGIQEANMIGTAAGLALSGYTPFCCSFACFLTGRFDQIKMSVAYSEAPVRMIGTHAGVGIGPDGYSQQGLEDLALMRTLPLVDVFQPADDIETEQMIRYLCENRDRPAYVRMTRQGLPRVHSDDYEFQPGRFSKLMAGSDLAIVATGGCVANALEAATTLSEHGKSVSVYNS